MNNDDRVIAMLEQLRQEQSVISRRLDNVDAQLDDLKKITRSIQDSQLIVELEKFPEIQSALDGLKSGEERDDFLDGRVTHLEAKIEEHDTRLFTLEYAAG